MCPQSNHISKQELTDILMSVFHKEFCVYLDKPGRFMEAGKEQMHTALLQMEKEQKVIQGRIQRMEIKEADAYMDYREGKLSCKEYACFQVELEDGRRKLEKQKRELEEKQKRLEKMQEKYLKELRSLLKFKNPPALQDGLLKKKGEKLTTELVDALVEKIYVYPEKRSEVQLWYVNKSLEGAVR